MNNMDTIKDWVSGPVQEFKDSCEGKKGYSNGYNQLFHRVIPRAVIRKDDIFYSPASGITVFSEIVNDPTESLIQVKGRNFSINDLTMMDFPKGKYYVLSVFMTFYDQHNNYIPYDSVYKSYSDLPPLQTYNMSMLDMENTIVNNMMVNYDVLSYMFNNQRRLNKFTIPHMNNYEYFITQIADIEVNQIISFHKLKTDYPTEKIYLKQGTPFGKIQKGSSCEIILPLDKAPFTIEEQYIKSKENWHIEAGIDPILKIKALK